MSAHPSPEKKTENAKLQCCLKYLLIAQFKYNEFQ